MDLVTCVIVNYNRKDLLVRCLDSLRNQSYTNLEVIVVDNASNDGSEEIVRRRYPEVRLVANGGNQLYCGGQNQGIRRAKGEYILCLNNDCILSKDYIERLVEAMGSHTKIGMAAGKILSADGRRIDSAGQFLGKSRKPIDRGYRQEDKGQYEKREYVFGASGVAALYRRDMLESIKIPVRNMQGCKEEYFDETYGMFYEDLDICWRANRYGWKAFYNPEAVAYHLRGGSTKTCKPLLGFLKNYDFSYLPSELQLHFIKNRYITILKNDTIKDFLANFPSIAYYEFKLWAYIIIFRPKLILGMIKNFQYLMFALKRRWLLSYLDSKPKR